jgi:aryl-alcohol dehydrogenase-like predicted oxidoreductase
MTTPVPPVERGNGLIVSAIGFGAMALTSIYGEVDDTKSLATLNHCLDIGVNFLDTANERLIAKLFQNRRNELTLATKFGIAGNPSNRAAAELRCDSAAFTAVGPARSPKRGHHIGRVRRLV